MMDRRTLLGSGLSLYMGALARPAVAATASHVWTFDNLNKVGRQAVELIGSPKLTSSPWGSAVLFDGEQDGLFIGTHPLAGASTFTFEAIFRPDGGAFEQRWFHLESEQVPAVGPGKGDTRMLYELRAVNDRWYLDAFMTGQGYRQAMMVPAKTYPVGRWYHVAQSYDGKIYRSFINGELQMEAAMPFVPQGPGKASVGVRMNRVNFFKGAVRLARFSHHALAPSEFLTRLVR